MTDGVFRKAAVAGIMLAAMATAALGIYWARSLGTAAGLYAELSRQRALLETGREQAEAMAENLRIIAELEKPRVLPLSDIAPAIANLSAGMAAAGISETFFKLEQNEIFPEGDGAVSVNRVVIGGEGAYEAIISYLGEMLGGGYYYYFENITVTRQSGGARLSAVCVIAGYGSGQAYEAPEIPDEYLYRNPFGESPGNESSVNKSPEGGIRADE